MADLKITISKIVSGKSLFKVVLRHSINDKMTVDQIVETISKSLESRSLDLTDIVDV